MEVTNSYGCSTVSPINNITNSNSSCNASTPTGLSSVAIAGTTFSLNWLQGQSGDSIIVSYRSDTSSNNYSYIRMLNIGQSLFTLSNLLSNTTYGWKVNTVCGSTQGTNSVEVYFRTGVSTGIDPVPNNQGELIVDDMKIYPNPAQNEAQIDYASVDNSNGEITVIDINSRKVYSEKVQLKTGDNKFFLNTSEYGNGIYFISFKSTETILVKKIIISH